MIAQVRKSPARLTATLAVGLALAGCAGGGGGVGSRPTATGTTGPSSAATPDTDAEGQAAVGAAADQVVSTCRTVPGRTLSLAGSLKNDGEVRLDGVVEAVDRCTDATGRAHDDLDRQAAGGVVEDVLAVRRTVGELADHLRAMGAADRTRPSGDGSAEDGGRDDADGAAQARDVQELRQLAQELDTLLAALGKR